MSFGFPAYYTESRSYPYQTDTLAAMVKSALEDLGWRYESPTGNEFHASASISLWSWGERLRVVILPGGVLRVESRCAFPLQCIDWGKNKGNVHTFFGQVERVKGRHILSPPAGERAAAFDEKGRSPVERIFNEQDGG